MHRLSRRNQPGSGARPPSLSPLAGLCAVALVLAGCAARVAEPVAIAGFRNAAAPFSSIALFEPARFAGRWHEVARFPGSAPLGCGAAVTSWTPRGDGGFSVETVCDGGPRRAGSAAVSGPGRFAVTFPDAPALSGPHWVLWVDEGYRTAVIGMPSGAGGWVLNRDPGIPSDRLTAARELLDFNGYDVTRLERVAQ